MTLYLVTKALAPDLLDLSYDEVHSSTLPDAQYLPAIERQRELELELLNQKVSFLLHIYYCCEIEWFVVRN